MADAFLAMADDVRLIAAQFQDTDADLAREEERLKLVHQTEQGAA